MEFGTPQFWVAGFQIIIINILLSGDNAVVIALASRSLPEAQRKWAVIGGSAAAVILRIILCLIIASVLQIPYLKLIGGLLLVYIGVKLVIAEEQSEEEIAAKSNLLGAIQTILIADAVMSLDNVVAIAAAAHDSVLLITLGLLISIPLIVFGSQLMLRVLGKYPILVSLGGGHGAFEAAVDQRNIGSRRGTGAFELRQRVIHDDVECIVGFQDARDAFTEQTIITDKSNS